MRRGPRNVVLAVFGLVVVAFAARYLMAKKGSGLTLVLDPADGCRTHYSSHDGHQLDVPKNGTVYIQIDSLSSPDTTVRQIYVRLQRQVDGKWVNYDDARPIDKNYPGQQTIGYVGLTSGKFRAAYWRDSTDCHTAKITSTPNGLRLFAE